MNTARLNYILPATSQFDAMVDGKPTGLAGCTRAQCPRAGQCLRASPALSYRVDLGPKEPGDCPVYIRAD
jgi:hypothetical protein